jgi:hypothetical protein
LPFWWEENHQIVVSHMAWCDDSPGLPKHLP